MLFFNMLTLKTSLLTLLQTNYHWNLFIRSVEIWESYIPFSLNRSRILFNFICYVYFVFTNTILQQIIVSPTTSVCLYKSCIQLYIILCIFVLYMFIGFLITIFNLLIHLQHVFYCSSLHLMSFLMCVANYVHLSIHILIHILFKLPYMIVLIT